MAKGKSKPSKGSKHGKATASTSYSKIKQDAKYDSGNLHTKANTVKGGNGKNMCTGGMD